MAVMGATIRLARSDDLSILLALIQADPISSSRSGQSTAVTAEVLAAFAAIEQSADHQLWVAEQEGEAIGVYQLSFLPGLARNGMWRAIVESVHVRADWRNTGVGESMMRHAIGQAQQRGCGLIQLTSDKRRTDAHRFYLRLGFVASHEGMKLSLESRQDALPWQPV